MTNEDHDVLIELNTKIKTLCGTISEIKTDIKQLNGNTVDFQKEVNKRPKWIHLITIFTCLIGLTAAVIGYNFDQDVKAADKIDKIGDKVVEHDTILKRFKR